MKSKKIAGLIATALTSAVVFIPNTTIADSVQQVINVFTGINVYVNDNKLPETNINNNPTAFVYNGTIYVAAGTLAKSLNQNAVWDAQTNSLYIGSHSDSSIVQNQQSINRGGNLLDICPPYQTHKNYKVFDVFTIAGKKYNKGFILGAYSPAWALYNLDDKFNVLSFDIGHIDGEDMHNGLLNIYLDKNLVSSIKLTPDMMPTHYDVTLKGARQMKMEFSNKEKCAGGCYAIFNATIR
ncbi:MAG: hypothetical protein IJ563_09440 [Selenomonadaceae bacterium]|nr:hypothetical protein [Selenomonadaceae bacterium]MBR1858239.1 hypothetical protein [Selenomonadaceae bacterium]